MRILIADPQTRVRFALRVALGGQPASTIAEASDAEDVIAQARDHCPNLAILAWELPGMPIAELMGVLRTSCRDMRVIVLSSRAEMRDWALANGADAFVSMCDSPDELLSAINRLLERTTVQTDESAHA